MSLHTDESYHVIVYDIIKLSILLLPFCAGLHWALPQLAMIFSQSYREMKPLTQRKCDADILSLVCTGITAIPSAICYFSTNDYVSQHAAVMAYAMLAAYAIAHIVILLFTVSAKEASIWYLHHAIALCAAYFCVHSTFMIRTRVLAGPFMELANCPINTRLILQHIQYGKHRLLYKVTLILMIVSFFIFRILPIPLVAYNLFAQCLLRGPERCSEYNYILLLTMLYVLITSMNANWFYKMLKGLYRYFAVPSNREKET